MKKLLLLLLMCLLSPLATVFAFETTDFIVELGSDSVKVWEPVDLTIKAVDDSWALVDDYDGEVLMIIDNLTDEEYELPQDGIYEFTEEDLWEKTFSKWLIIDKAGTYTLVVEDFLDDTISWEVEITVNGGWEEWNDDFNVEILSPTINETVKSSSLDVLGTSDHKNGKIYAYVDGVEVWEGATEANGDYSITLNNLSNGTHSLKVKAVDIFDETVWESDEISFEAEVNDNWFKSIDVLPSNVVDQWTTIEVTVETVPEVTEVTLNIPSMKGYPMEKASRWVFKVEILMDVAWVFDLDLKLISEWVSKNYERSERVTVIEKKRIKNVKFVRNDAEKFIKLDWEYDGQIDYFRVVYSTSKGDLEWELSLDSSATFGDDGSVNLWWDSGLDIGGNWETSLGWLGSIGEDGEPELVGNGGANQQGSVITEVNKYTIETIADTKAYFVTIYPVDSEGTILWDDSGLIVIEPGAKHEAAVICSIDNIALNVVGTEENSYLEWEEVDWMVTYIVYKGKDRDNLSEIAQLTGTTYPLPFDVDATEEIYEYFSVKAVCDDGTINQIDDIKKVKVGPMDWLIWATIITMMSYGLYIAYRKEEA